MLVWQIIWSDLKQIHSCFPEIKFGHDCKYTKLDSVYTSGGQVSAFPPNSPALPPAGSGNPLSPKLGHFPLPTKGWPRPPHGRSTWIAEVGLYLGNTEVPQWLPEHRACLPNSVLILKCVPTRVCTYTHTYTHTVSERIRALGVVSTNGHLSLLRLYQNHGKRT